MTSWSPPSELDKPPPRRVGINTFQTWLMPLIFILLILQPAMRLRSDLIPDIQNITLRFHGVETKGKVEKVRYQDTKRGTIYFATYGYRAGNQSDAVGEFLSAESRITSQEYIDTEIGDDIPVVYDQNHPDRSIAKSQLDRNFLWLDLIPLIIPMVIVGVLGGFLARTYFLEKKLLESGNVVQARIIKEMEYTQRYGRFSRLTYEFKDSSGNVITGIRKGVPTEDAVRARSAAFRARFFDNPTAIYDPQNSARNMLYPPSAAKLL